MICFAWAGFPQYAARCIRKVVQGSKEEVVVIAAKPKVPVLGMDELVGCKVIWISYFEQRSLKELLGGEVPRFLFVSGWHNRVFRRFGKEAHAFGGKVVAMVDNNWMLSGKNFTSLVWWKLAIFEFIKAIRFRICYRFNYDGFIVPGKSGERLLQFYGVPKRKITQGLYSADSELFSSGGEISKRSKIIIYVGQYIERKNVRRMLIAFAEAACYLRCAWKLVMYGSGELRTELDSLAKKYNQQLSEFGAKIEVNNFLQPEELAPLYREACFFCLPSTEEHWGLVVHEAALSGCLLMLSKYIGAADDLFIRDENGTNGIIFDPYNKVEMKNAFISSMGMDLQLANKMQSKSVEKAKKISTSRFATAVFSLLAKLRSSVL